MNIISNLTETAELAGTVNVQFVHSTGNLIEMLYVLKTFKLATQYNTHPRSNASSLNNTSGRSTLLKEI